MNIKYIVSIEIICMKCYNRNANKREPSDKAFERNEKLG